MSVTIMCRSKVFVNTDPQRRCYNGAFKSYRYDWGQWEELDTQDTKEDADERLKFWKELNDYAVSQRGDGAKREFEIRCN